MLNKSGHFSPNTFQLMKLALCDWNIFRDFFMLCKLIFCFCMTVGGNVNVCNLVPWQSKDRWCLDDRWSRLVYRVFKVLSQNIRCTQYVTHMQLRYISIACVWHTVWFRVQIISVTPAHNINSNEVIFHKISFVFIAWLTRVANVFLCMHVWNLLVLL